MVLGDIQVSIRNHSCNQQTGAMTGVCYQKELNTHATFSRKKVVTTQGPRFLTKSVCDTNTGLAHPDTEKRHNFVKRSVAP